MAATQDNILSIQKATALHHISYADLGLPQEKVWCNKKQVPRVLRKELYHERMSTPPTLT